MLVSKWQILGILCLLLSLGCGDDSNHDGDSHAHGGDDTGMGGDDTGCTPGDADELTVDYYAFVRNTTVRAVLHTAVKPSSHSFGIRVHRWLGWGFGCRFIGGSDRTRRTQPSLHLF